MSELIQQIDFRDLITSRTPELVAAELWKAYKTVKADPYKRHAKYIEKDFERNGSYQSHIDLDRIDDFDRCYRTMESVRNSGVSQIGTLCNEMVQHSYELLGIRVKPEHKLQENTSRRAIDIFAQDLAVYVSVTTTPRERKRGDWAHELDQLVGLSKQGMLPKDWQFVGLMFEGTTREPLRIQDELRRASAHASVIMVKDVEQHASFLRYLCERNQ